MVDPNIHDNLDENASVEFDYLPYSSETMHDNTQLEDDNIITVITGNRYNRVKWSDDRNMPAEWIPKNHSGWSDHSNLPDDWRPNFYDGWSDTSILPGNWNLTEDSHIPDGWITTNQEEPSYEGWRNDTTLPRNWKASSNNITAKRDNRCILASKLPTIFVTNHRSFFPKYRNFVEVMHTLDLTLGLHSEIWEDKEKKDHQDKVEEARELEGINYISNSRPDRRGGGAAISLICDNFTLTKLDVLVPKNLEVVWGLVRPKKTGI